MERRDKESRQSSLPSSLIPHLYSGPQQPDDPSTAAFPTALPLLPRPVSHDSSAEQTNELPSMRSTLTLPPVISSFAATSLLDNPRRSPQFTTYESRSVSTDYGSDLHDGLSDRPGSSLTHSLGSLYLPSQPRQQRYVSPIVGDPIFHTPRPQRPHELNSFLMPAPQESVFARTAWQEGEAGPSSLIHSTHRDHGRDRGRRGSSQPAQFRPRSSFNRGGESDEECYYMEARERMEGARRGVGNSHPQTSLYGSWALDSFSDTSRYNERLSSERSMPYLPGTFPSVAAAAPHRTWSGTLPVGAEPLEVPLAYSPGSVSERSSDARPDEEGEDDQGSHQKGIKRGRGSDGTEENPRKSRNPRKTAVACNFCRGRKLRCNGAKPSCYNCAVRKFQCEYVPVQRRRGPGKAPKGSKSKKGGRSESSTSAPPGDRTSSSIQESLPTEYPPHTSVISLESFSFQTPEPLRHASPSQSVSTTGRRGGDFRPLSSPEPDSEDGGQ